MTTGVLFAETALIDGRPHRDVRLQVADGILRAVEVGAAPTEGDVRLGCVLPAAVNAHSHAFHRVVRGRTHDRGGDFWRWRDQMYAVAARLDPERYHRLATAVYAEMLAAGWTAVGEFHYVHHRPSGRPYDLPHAVELALAHAARDVGIRLTLLDACYLAGGPGRPLAAEQRRFADADADAWLERWHALRDRLGADVVLGAAIHSVRAVPPAAIARIVAGLPADVPLHVHVSEQPQENVECRAAHGVTPTRLLHDAGALTARTSAVHATHVTAGDVRMIGAAGATVVMCPTTEADLGDGIGPARALADAGAAIALGSDQNAVVDPFLEVRGLEAGERLGSGERGRFRPAELLAAMTEAGSRSIGRAGGIRVGAPCDLIEVDTGSVRTAGAAAAQLPLVATASDVRRVVVGGVVRADRGTLVAPGGARRDPAVLLAEVLAEFPTEGAAT